MSISGIVACGGGGGGDDVAGIGGTGITASGSITGFGSIYVNGIRFDVDSADITVDGDDTVDDTALKLGMVVKVEGTVNADGLTGTASSVEFDDLLQGPVNSVTGTGNTRTLSILGVDVIVYEESTVLAGVLFDHVSNLDLNDLVTASDVVEISGYIDESNRVRATRLEYVEPFSVSAEIEARGIVTDKPTATEFDLDINGDGSGDRLVNTNSSSLKVADLTIGDLVEVNGVFLTAASDSTIYADDVEFEDGALGGSNGEASLEGIVTSLSTALKTFVLNGVTVNYSAATFEPATLATTIADGMQVEVEGNIIGGSILNADEVEAEDEIELATVVSNVVGSTITMTYNASYDVDVITDAGTEYEDDVGVGISSPSDINISDYLIIEGYLTANGSILAAQVKRATPEDDIIQGPVSACGGGSITILGVVFNLTDGITDYFDQNELPLADSTAFCNAVNAGTYFAEIKDKANADGTADEAELED
jgi:hypothetical protein